VASPYLWSLVTFSPDLQFIAGMPFMVKLHFAGAFVLFAVFPFSRLVHILVVPNPYLWRRPQVVRWYRARPGRAAA
jgi:nitrate reductase gamma subunit